MFASVRAEYADRLFAAESFVKAFVPDKPPISKMATAAKGMAFVQMYAAWEYTVNNAFVAAITTILDRKLQFQEMRHDLLAIALDDEFKAVRDCGRDRFVEKRVGLLKRINSSDVIASACGFPLDGSQYRPEQLETIWTLFGITEPISPHPFYAQVIRDVVEHRNAIAHGRERPETIGRTFSRDAVLHKIKQTRLMCEYVTKVLEDHCADASKIER